MVIKPEDRLRALRRSYKPASTWDSIRKLHTTQV